MTSIEDRAFYGCSSIKSFVINDGKEKLQLFANPYFSGGGLLSSCPLEYVYIGADYYWEFHYGSYDSYYESPFCNSEESITEIAFGKYIQNIPFSLRNISKLETITLYNPTPLDVSSDYFTNAQYINVNVYVPKGSLEAYQKADVWKNFWGLQEKELTGIETVVADGNNTDNIIYDMQGRRLDAPKAGLNIINGKKVMIRK